MLLTVDVGNTNITLGLFKGDKVFANLRLKTQSARTSDEYGSLIAEMIVRKGIDISSISDVIIASVVPKVMYSLNSGIMKYFGIKPIIVGVGTKTGIKINRTDPREVGADRIVDAVAAYELYGGPCIVIDFGTATTYDLISENGTLEAGVISPGIQICAKALWDGTAKLPEVEIKKPDSILGKDIITNMQAGIVYGYIGQTEYIVNKIKGRKQNKRPLKLLRQVVLEMLYTKTQTVSMYMIKNLLCRECELYTKRIKNN